MRRVAPIGLSILICLAAHAQTTRPVRELPVALQKALADEVIIVGDGVVCGGITIRQPGVTIRAANKWRTVIAGSPTHGVHVLADRVTLDGIQVLGAVYSGIKTERDYTAIRNCWVHHNGLNGIEAHNLRGTRIEHCLLERNGCHPNLCHGAYADGESGEIRENIARHNAAMGLALGGNARGFVVERNVCHDNGTEGIGLWRYGVPPNRVTRNTIARNRYGIRLAGLAGDVLSANALWRNRNGEVFNQTSATVAPSPACPGFVDPEFGVYWPTATTSVGAYDYDPSRSRDSWPHTPWAYQFDPARGQPDLWSAVQ